jgi:hypothetical protein
MLPRSLRPTPRSLLIVLLVGSLPGCSVLDGGREPFLVLESAAYKCGASDGLGCGLAIAPALVRLDALQGVRESRVSWDGRWFRLQLEPGADADRVAAEAQAILEGPEQRVDAQDAPGEDAGWWNAEGTLELSLHEASELAADFTAEIAAAAQLDEPKRAQVGALIREELAHAFERAHAAGGGVPRLWEQLPPARAAFEQRLDFLTALEKSKVSEFLDRAFGA